MHRSSSTGICNFRLPLTCLFFFIVAIPQTTNAQQKGKLKVFILAGQSNMEGHARVETFDYIGDDPATAPLLKEMRNPDGSPRVCDNVWISYLTGIGDQNGEGTGKLTAGYGSRRNPAEDGGKIGPEFTFGIRMDRAFDEPILIIKTAWGGKSIYYDFRSPSAGPFERSAQDIEKKRRTAERTGHYYRLMIDHVKGIRKDIKRVYPDYDEKLGHEIAGFVWFQGFNDLVARDIYPDPESGSKANRFAKYSTGLAALIRDVRKDLDVPEMPFVIGVIGTSGKIETMEERYKQKHREFREAMAAPASYPEFKGTVAAVQTAPFWDEELAAIVKKREQVKRERYLLGKNQSVNKDGKMTKAQIDVHLRKFESELISKEERLKLSRGASNAGYHYLGSAKTMALIGKAFAESMIDLQKK